MRRASPTSAAATRDRGVAASDVYARVYDADRPELFLKDAACRRTVGPGDRSASAPTRHGTCRSRRSALVLGDGGEIVGYTIGNDVSSRDIEGANPLYLPQAKVFAGACALGPAVLVTDERDRRFEIELRILDADGGSSSRARVDRAHEARLRRLVVWLVRDNPVPAGSVLLTGTGLVPPDDFTLQPGHMVEIHVPGIGTLRNQSCSQPI